MEEGSHHGRGACAPTEAFLCPPPAPSLDFVLGEVGVLVKEEPDILPYSQGVEQRRALEDEADFEKVGALLVVRLRWTSERSVGKEPALQE